MNRRRSPLLTAVTFLTVLGAAAPALAQKVETGVRPAAHSVTDNDMDRGLIVFGLVGADFGLQSTFDRQLSEAGFRSTAGGALSSGVGVQGNFGRLTVTTSYRSRVKAAAITNGDAKRRTDVNASILAIDVGYTVWRSRRVRFTPFIGSVTQLQTVRLSTDAKLTPSTLGEAVADPARSTQLGTFALGSNVGLGIDLLLTKSEKVDGHGGLVLGMRAGYSVLSPIGLINVDGNGVPQPSNPVSQGLFVQLTLGGGFFQ